MKTPGDKARKLARLQKREERLVYKGNKAVDEGREQKANRLLGRAAKVQDRKIRIAETMKKGGMTKKSLTKAQPGTQVTKKGLFGRTIKKSENEFLRPTGETINEKNREVYNKQGDLIKSKTKRTVSFEDGTKTLKYNIKSRPGEMSKITNVRSVSKNGGSVKSKKK